MPADDVVIVTGAGGNLGAAVCERLASTGARLAVVERADGRLASVMNSLADPGRHLGVPGLDLGEPAACAALVERVLGSFGRIDGLAHTVGSFAMAGIDAADPAHWELLYRANLLTTLNMCRAVVPAMRAAGRGSIVTVGCHGRRQGRQGHGRLRGRQERRAAG